MNGAAIFNTFVSKYSISKLLWSMFPYLAGKPISQKKQQCQHPCMTMTHFRWQQVVSKLIVCITLEVIHIVAKSVWLDVSQPA